MFKVTVVTCKTLLLKKGLGWMVFFFAESETMFFRCVNFVCERTFQNCEKSLSIAIVIWRDSNPALTFLVTN